MTGREAARGVFLLCLAAAAMCSPFMGIPALSTALMTTVCIYGLAASGLNLMFGYAGMLSLGNAMFLGVGGYAVAISTQDWHWPWGAGVVLAVAATVAVAAGLGLLLVRLLSHYFAVATLALSLAFDALLVAVPGTGGGTGLTTRPVLDLGFVRIVGDFRWYVVTGIVTVVLLVVLAWMVAGKRGRLLRLVRHDELAAEVLGVPVFWAKLLVFTLGALLAGIAGVLLYLSQGFVNPDSVGTLISVQLAMLIVIGGPGYRVGGLVGAFTVLWLQALINALGNYELLLYGVVLLAVVFYLKMGIEGVLVETWHRTPIGRALRLQPVALGGVLRLSEPAAATASSTALDVSARRPGAGLEVRSARRAFGGVVAVDDVSIVVPAGAITGLIGANGAGKSTLINLISGVERLDGGSIVLDGEDIGALTPAQRTKLGLSRTFQVPRLVDELSVLENMVLGHEAAERPLLRRDRPTERRRMDDAMATLRNVGLGALADRAAGSLGTGERKYVEVARAIFSEASVLLLDEPAVGLSPEEVTQLRAWLEVMRASGTALLVVDHNMDFMTDVADHVYSMESGRINWEGAPGAIVVSSRQETPARGLRPGASPLGEAVFP